MHNPNLMTEGTLPNSWGHLTPFDWSTHANALHELQRVLRLSEKFQDPLETLPFASLRTWSDGDLEVHHIGATAILAALNTGIASGFDTIWTLNPESEWEHERMTWALAAGSIRSARDTLGDLRYFAELHPRVQRQMRNAWGSSGIPLTSPMFQSRDEALEWLESTAEDDRIDVSASALKAGSQAATRELVVADLDRYESRWAVSDMARPCRAHPSTMTT